MKRQNRIAVFIIALVAIWVLGVDWSWFVYNCPDCGYGKDIAQYRLFTIPVQETTRDFPTIAQRVADDLGVPCSHKNSTTWHKHRWWGLLVCYAPCINGTLRLINDDSWYDQEASGKVAALAEKDSSLRIEFVRKVFEKHDFDFVHTVLVRAGIDSKPPNERITKQ
jgi:hypothetical protein